MTGRVDRDQPCAGQRIRERDGIAALDGKCARFVHRDFARNAAGGATIPELQGARVDRRAAAVRVVVSQNRGAASVLLDFARPGNHVDRCNVRAVECECAVVVDVTEMHSPSCRPVSDFQNTIGNRRIAGVVDAGRKGRLARPTLVDRKVTGHRRSEVDVVGVIEIDRRVACAATDARDIQRAAQTALADVHRTRGPCDERHVHRAAAYKTLVGDIQRPGALVSDGDRTGGFECRTSTADVDRARAVGGAMVGVGAAGFAADDDVPAVNHLSTGVHVQGALTPRTRAKCQVAGIGPPRVGTAHRGNPIRAREVADPSAPTGDSCAIQHVQFAFAVMAHGHGSRGQARTVSGDSDAAVGGAVIADDRPLIGREAATIGNQ